ncbi:DNA polymerase III subunit alpha [Propionibacterium freudenreichii]|uniref:DNA polymerase III subunit alpha n=1 Tax=Propionibacterium freudenreichii TaxID=1744 RepID=UPI00254AB302|nr:DNA polymerase III subunit alpha [Propionibacterium freudenreichii]MDK9301976.1 DNA polymerase III subunit alpha [Propionibacterium freudenreichii]MDK9322430.1 DNA polymerase III subunit alpha [Propionibacterium freudenreichii]MDK9324814.1 DNA polymerase III subunit alpha [Propionibacterium freudenreichii]MDK9338849.1 DNA polymerase III subunit alpha [Propionibacterium freudenreichii]MDK9648829.1 DNA polymerase III subunit alpha [Propionibacterium freudenreichii]
MASKNFAHLHVHTEYSMLDGAASNDKLFAEVARQGMPAVAMTDHGNMFGAYEFYQTAKKYDGEQNPLVKPIIGIEAYVAPSTRLSRSQEFWGNRRDTGSPDTEGGKDVSGGGRYTHMTMLAANATGLHNLFKLSSLASYEGYYMKPRMDRELIAKYSEGIIGSTGCPSGEVQTRLRLGQFEEACEAAAAYQDILGKENYYCELMDHGVDIEHQVRADLLRLAKRLKLPLLATNDSHYVTEDQADDHDNLLCIGVGRNKDDPDRFRFNGSGYYIKTAAEMRALFPGLEEAADNTLAIAERIESYEEVFSYVDRMPQFDVPAGETQESWLRKKVKIGLKKHYGDHPSDAVMERVETELKVIEPLGFSSYFLVVSDICDAARKMGVPVGPGRGSAAGSIIAYLTDIIAIDPLEHGLLFERFLNPERVNPPDIDLDFDDRQRDKVIDYVTHKYGEEYTSQVNTFNKIKAKAAVKDANRILGYPFSLGDRITKAMPPDVMGKGVPLNKLFDESNGRYSEGQEFRNLYNSDPDVKRVVDTGMGIEGLIRGSGVHACAFILSSEKLLNLVPMHKRDKDGMIIAGFAYPQLEEMGLMKMDFLGLRNLGIMDHCVKNIKRNRGEDVDLQKLPLDDAATYELMARGDTLGVFQLDGGAMRSLLRQMGPTCFDDIIAVLALYRPGPMGANAHIEYADRKNGRRPIVPIHPELKDDLDEILAPTYHLIVYQEQIMAIARKLAGYTLGGADLLRRAMGKKKKYILDENFKPFQKGMRDNGYSDESIQALWDVMVPFAGYAFNKSHATGYALVSYWTAYLKANYPAEYGAALLTSVGDDKDKMALYLSDMRAQRIKVLAPDVNASEKEFTAVGEDIRFGLGAIRNVGDSVVGGIVGARTDHGPAHDFFEFLDNVPLSVCNKRCIESLIKAGAFDSMGHSRRALMDVFETAVDGVIDLKRNQANGQDDLFGDLGGGDAESDPAMNHTVPDIPDWDKRTKLAFEREMLGLYVSDHPLRGLEHVLSAERTIGLGQIAEQGAEADGHVEVICGMITQVQRKQTKKGAFWAIIDVEDLDASMQVLIFPKVYETCLTQLSPDTIVRIRGRVVNKDESLEMQADELTLPDIRQSSGGPVTIRLPLVRCTPPIVAELRQVLTAHPGSTEVRVQLVGPQSDTVLRVGDGLRVTNEQPLVADLKALLGPASVAV